MENDGNIKEVLVKKSSFSVPSWINTIVFVLILSVAGFSTILFSKSTISDLEKRQLSVMPGFSWNHVTQGTFGDSLDAYLSDHFIYRDQLCSFSFWLKENRGVSSEEITIYRPTPKQKPETNIPSDINDTTWVWDTTGMMDDKGEMVDGWIFIWKGMALQMFGGSNTMAQKYASVINEYHEVLGNKVTIYNIVFPSPAEFYLPAEYRKYTTPEKANIDMINSNLTPGIRVVDAYGEMFAHKNEYLYFRTDHHWTVMGAYYAYKAFCSKAGFQPLDLSTLTKKTKKRFIGSLYATTHDSRLKMNPDSVDYYIIPGNYKTYGYYADNQTKPIRVSLLAEGAKGGYSYGVFLGADFPLMKVETDIKNGRRALIVKNSYGNAFSPFLVAHYEQVFIVDYRYFRLGIINLILDNNITDLIFINSVVLANGSWHQQCIKKGMYFRNVPVDVPKDTVGQTLPGDSIMGIDPDSLKIE